MVKYKSADNYVGQRNKPSPVRLLAIKYHMC